VDLHQIATRDGLCRSYVGRPAGGGPWPAVLVYMDGLGIRPAMLEIGERLCSYGYYVLLPDLYYRVGPYAPMDAHAVFTDPEQRRILTGQFFATTTPARVMSDTRAYLDFLAAEPAVRPGGIGTTGYCMGGRMSLTAAGTYPQSITRRPPITAGDSRRMIPTAHTAWRIGSVRACTSAARATIQPSAT